MMPSSLFFERPHLNFHPNQETCDCGHYLNNLKTDDKIISTLDIGEFIAKETHKICKKCNKIYRSDELRSLTPNRGKFGFDVIVFIGKALFLQCTNELTIQTELAKRNIPISLREIAFLGKRFIVYLSLAHKACQDDVKHYMNSKGGYILHLDGTHEGDSPHLLSSIDEITTIVLGNRKMPTEDSQYIIPFLLGLKSAYGNPIALVHDMGRAILKAIANVFPSVPDYICHFHFLRDIGKDLCDFEYRTIRRYLRSHDVRAKLNRVAKQLKTVIDDDKTLSDCLTRFLQSETLTRSNVVLLPTVTAYLLVTWILESSSASNGYGFPFDQPHVDFYLRLEEAYPILRQLKTKMTITLPLDTLRKTLTDPALKNLISHILEKTKIFGRLRETMRIACPENNYGLNDEGDDDVKTIESRLKEFRYSKEIKRLASNNLFYSNMVKQIDKYWDKLFAKPIQVNTSEGKITIQPQRTNNIMEQSFRFLKKDGRKKSGQHSLTKTLKWMLADTPLVRNLSNSDYVKILLKGKKDLAERFADIDIQLVLEEEKENEKRWKKYPKGMTKVFRISNLPREIS